MLAFHDMPVEAYPDIADNYVTIISQWPGRSAEEVEQQVTIPIEIQMGGLPHLSAIAIRVPFWPFVHDARL